MRGMIRATAESHGGDTIIKDGKPIFIWKRDPKLAEAMVDERVVIPGLVDSTQVLTLTANEARRLGYCEGIAKNVDDIATRYLHYDNYTIETYNPTAFDSIKGFLMNAFVQSILIMLIVGGIFLELNSPGIGLPAAIALTAAILYFTPLYLNGYAQSWEILIFVLGLILIVFELFVIPGFGIAGILGIILIILSLLLALIGNIHFDFKGVPVSKFYRALLVVFSGLGLGALVIVYFSSRIGKRGILKNAALQADEEGFLSVSTEPLALVGKTATAATVLRPSGRIEVDHQFYDAVSIDGFIDKDELVYIEKYENSQLYVSKKKKE
jgi:membrane-bound serine protease (ClpP class)